MAGISAAGISEIAIRLGATALVPCGHGKCDGRRDRLAVEAHRYPFKRWRDAGPCPADPPHFDSLTLSAPCAPPQRQACTCPNEIDATGKIVIVTWARDTVAETPLDKWMAGRERTPWTSDRFRASWRKACAAIGITGLTFTGLRGTAVKRLTLAGCTETEIATITGHSLRDVRSIPDAHYLHRDPSLATSAIRKLEESKQRTKTTKWPRMFSVWRVEKFAKNPFRSRWWV